MREKLRGVKLPSLKNLHWPKIPSLKSAHVPEGLKLPNLKLSSLSASELRIGVLSLFALVLLACLAYWKAPMNGNWSDEDFSFYNDSGSPVMEPSLDNPLVVSQIGAQEAVTFRGVRVGDDAKEALKKYNWRDYELVVFKAGELYGDYDLTREYNARAANIDDLINLMDEIVRKGYALKLRVLVYKQNGKLITRSRLNGDDGLQPFQKLMYIFAMEIEDGKVHTVVAENNYLREMARCYELNNGMLPENDSYEWLRILGK